MKVIKYKDYSLNEGFRDVFKKGDIKDLFNRKNSYKDGVASCLTDIITKERGISEKSFNMYDDVMKEVENFYNSNEEVIKKLVDSFEQKKCRKEFCAETIYNEYFT